MKSDPTVQCDVVTHCAHLYMLFEWVFCSVNCREVYLRENFTNFQTVKNVKNSNFSSSNLLTRTKATGLPVALKYGTARRFEDRFVSHTRPFLRMVVLFAVLLVDHEE